MEHNDRKIHIISSIDDDIIENSTLARMLHLKKLKKHTTKAWLPWVAMAACLCIVVGATLALLPTLLSSGKQVPIYQGMTASGENPMVDNITAYATPDTPVAYLSSTSRPALRLLTETTSPKPTLPHEKHTEAVTESPTEAVSESPTESPSESPAPDFNPSTGVYYTKPNEDFYITVHINNPDNLEILSFTLTGVKYSSYMFEPGSNMENLVLKCNVGDTEGMVEYTIDAIKYVDGENIKDVRMEGERTIRIHVYPESNYITWGFTPDITHKLEALEGEYTLTAKLYQGDILVVEKTFAQGDNLTFTGLISDMTYVCKIFAVDNAGKEHALHEETFTTQNAVAIENVKLNGLTATFDIQGADAVTALALYEGDALYRELTIDTRKIEHLPIDKEISLVATYVVDGKNYQTTYVLPVIHESEGLHIVDGVIIGIGTCTDTVLYLNHPVKSSTFENNQFINEVYCGSGVTSIESYAFWGCLNLKFVVLSETLSYIDYATFSNCSNLTSIHIPHGVTSIEMKAFELCQSLTNLIIPDSVTTIGEEAFHYCRGLTNIVIPDSVTSLGNNAFSFCSSLSEIVISNNVTSFEISECDALTDLTIPSNVISVRIVLCPNLTNITIPEGIKSVDFTCCRGLTEVILPNSVESLYFVECSSLTSIVIPDGVTIIQANTFLGCTSLTDVVIPNSVTSIGQMAFHGCTSLISIVIPNSVTSISDDAFGDCSGLTNVVIPNSVISIGSAAFYGCTGLTSITIPQGVKKIDDLAFSGCTGLTSVTISQGVIEIGKSAFEECTNLTTLVLPNSLKPIGSNAFFHCTAIKEIYFTGTEQEWENHKKGFNLKVTVHYNYTPDDSET